MRNVKRRVVLKLCRHQKHKVIDHILEPKYSTDEILISVAAVPEDVEHFLIKFKKCNKYPDWFYMSRNDIVKGTKKQPNGRGEVYCVPLSRRQEFTPNKRCEHAD